MLCATTLMQTARNQTVALGKMNEAAGPAGPSWHLTPTLTSQFQASLYALIITSSHWLPHRTLYAKVCAEHVSTLPNLRRIAVKSA